MRKETNINQLQFNKLLEWLDYDLEIAASKYEIIRTRLTKIFTVKGHFDAENLADKTIDRVCLKLSEIIDNYSGRKELYFYGVARNIHLEALKSPVFTEVNDNLTVAKTVDNDEVNRHFNCLETCLKKLSEDDRRLILTYYQNEKAAKIEDRRKIADSLGITVNFLRLRVFRLRSELKNCVLECADKKS
jgi:DNA-directed RNA polymerase specialized sigma24 family protein